MSSQGDTVYATVVPELEEEELEKNVQPMVLEYFEHGDTSEVMVRWGEVLQGGWGTSRRGQGSLGDRFSRMGWDGMEKGPLGRGWGSHGDGDLCRGQAGVRGRKKVPWGWASVPGECPKVDLSFLGAVESPWQVWDCCCGCPWRCCILTQQQI